MTTTQASTTTHVDALSVLFPSGTVPPVLTDWLAQRRALGQDDRDEVWEGVYHVAPLEHVRNGLLASALVELMGPLARARGLRVTNPFNLGSPTDFRGPDLGLIRRDQHLQLYLPTAELVVEVLSPHDETWQKLPHYATHQVGEVWVVDPDQRSVQVLVLLDADYVRREVSPLLSLPARHVEQALDWPDA